MSYEWRTPEYLTRLHSGSRKSFHGHRETEPEKHEHHLRRSQWTGGWQDRMASTRGPMLQTGRGMNRTEQNRTEQQNSIFISAKWTKWMAEILCSFDVCACVCVSVCLSVRSGRSWELNANSSKTVKATDFKFDTRVPRDSPDVIPKKFSQKGAWPRSRDPQNFWALNANSSKTV